MNKPFNEVRARFEAAEDIDAAPLERAPNSAPPRTPDQSPLEARLIEGARLPLNDHGNGQRFVLHFGEDVMFVPKVGWFTWRGDVWEKDAGTGLQGKGDGVGLKTRAKAQGLSDLIMAEIPHLEMAARDLDILSGKDDLIDRIAVLDRLPKKDLDEAQKAELAKTRAALDLVSEVERRQKDRRSRHRSFATTTGNSGRIDNAAKEAGVALAVDFDDLDEDPLTINTANGVLRFSVDVLDDGRRAARMERLDHHRSQRLTKIMPVAYRPGATAEGFDRFLCRVQPDIEMRKFLQRWHGLGLTALKVQNLAIYYGSGANGKSVLVDLLSRIAGDYAATARIESLTGAGRRGGGDATPDLVPLMGARFVRTSEPDEGQRLQEGLIKELTGGEPLMVRALHSDFIEVEPVFKLTMSGNHKPEVRGTDDGIWRRLLLVPWEVQIPESERDLRLVEKLYQERSGILNWLIEGLLDYLENGLRPPQSVLDATKEYREESDPIGTFLVNCCEITGAEWDTIQSKAFGEAFNFHMGERGMTAWKPTTFAKQISAKAKTWKHPETGRGFVRGKSSSTQYLGIRFSDDFQTRLDLAGSARRDRGEGSPVVDDDYDAF